MAGLGSDKCGFAVPRGNGQDCDGMRGRLLYLEMGVATKPNQ